MSTPSSRLRPHGDDLAPRVVVTGIGLSTALGWSREDTWRGIREGRSAARVLDGPPPQDGPPHAGYPLPEHPPAGRDQGRDAPPPDPVHPLLESLSLSAADDARLSVGPGHLDPTRVGTLIGLSKGCVHGLARLHAMVRDPGSDPGTIARLWMSSWPGAGASLVSGLLGLRGPSLAPVAACATGLVAVLEGAELIRRGTCDVVLAGSADASLEPMLLAAFRRMKVLARVDDDPARAVRPWDRGRSGFLVGEGGAILVLERDDHARARGARPYAEVAGGALGSDAHHATDLDPDPSGLARVIGQALRRAGVPAPEIDHVNVHGTATRLNDPLECRSLRLALGAQADRVACSANKGQIGHLLGAAGAAELAIACLTIRDGFVPPTVNLTDPDPACDLDGTPGIGRELPIRAALKLSIGFGGHLAAIVLRRPRDPRREPWGTPHG